MASCPSTHVAGCPLYGTLGEYAYIYIASLLSALRSTFSTSLSSSTRRYVHCSLANPSSHLASKLRDTAGRRSPGAHVIHPTRSAAACGLPSTVTPPATRSIRAATSATSSTSCGLRLSHQLERSSSPSHLQVVMARLHLPPLTLANLTKRESTEE